MSKLIRSTMLVLAFTATATGALPTNGSRFVDEKSGYVVETRDTGAGLRISGRHPETGKTFKVKVSRAGRVVGEWNGKPVDYVMGTRSDVQLAAASAASAGGK